MDGLELQRRLIERAYRFPLIVITGHGDVPLAVRAMKAGAVDFIEKPFPTETILNGVAAALARLVEPRDQGQLAATAAGHGARTRGAARPARGIAQQIDRL